MYQFYHSRTVRYYLARVGVGPDEILCRYVIKAIEILYHASETCQMDFKTSNASIRSL